ISTYSGRVLTRQLEHMFTFARQVYAIVARVPYGRVISYGAIARLLGDPRKARQVGWAMAATPERRPKIPAHRVIRASGQLPGGDACGGYAAQRKRLESEGVTFLDDGRVDLDSHLWLPLEGAGAMPPHPSGRSDSRARAATREQARDADQHNGTE